MTGIEQAAGLASRSWGVAPESLSIRDITGDFPWVRDHRLVMVRHRSGRRLTVAVGPHETFPLASLDQINALLEHGGPDVADPTEFARAARMLLRGAGGFVAGRDFLARQTRAGLELWTGASRVPLEKVCEEPRFDGDAARWVLHFVFIAPDGAVERWEVSGSGRRIVESKVSEVMQSGAFVVPYA